MRMLILIFIMLFLLVEVYGCFDRELTVRNSGVESLREIIPKSSSGGVGDHRRSCPHRHKLLHADYERTAIAVQRYWAHPVSDSNLVVFDNPAGGGS
jgi:hypothetical protein